MFSIDPGKIVAANAGVTALGVCFPRTRAALMRSGVDFILSKLDFDIRLPEIFENGGHWAVKSKNGDQLRLSFYPGNDDSDGQIIFQTSDCLLDYHRFLISGIEFTARPEYYSDGLKVDFLDNQDNRYTLMEARIYMEHDKTDLI